MRRAVLVGVLAAFLVGAGLMVPAEAVASKVQLTRTSGAPTSGVPLALVVKVPNGLVGQKVWLEQKSGKKWKAVAKRKLGPSKQVSLTSALRLGGQKFRVHVFSKGNRKQAFRAFTLAVRPRVNPAPYINEAFTISGRLPVNGARPVKLQKRVGSSWSTVATKSASGTGVVAFARPGALPSAVYRFSAAKKGKLKAFASLGVTVAPAERTQLVSRTAAGGAGNGESQLSVISGNGRYVAFQSAASNLGPADANPGTDIYLRDLVARTTTLVSRRNGGPVANGASEEPVISYDGRYVAFASVASNLVASDGNGAMDDIFRYDRITRSIKLISHDNAGGASDGASSRASISANGNRIAYGSPATDLTAETDNNGSNDVFLWTGTTDTAVRVSKPANNATNLGGGNNPRISPDGSWIAFSSGSDDIAGGSAATVSTFLRNVQVGTTARVSTTTCTGGLTFPVGVSNGGLHTAYYSTCADVVPGDGNGTYDMFIRTMAGGAITLVSHTLGGDTGGSSSFGSAGLSADGNRMVFSSGADDLVALDGNGFEDVFSWVRSTGTLTLLSHRRDGVEGFGSNGDNSGATASENAKVVSWTSAATNVAVGDTSSGLDVYYRDLR